MAQTAERNNKVEVSSIGPCRKKLSIEIPRETVNESLDLTLATLSTDAALPGFRAGRVPKRLIEKKFGTVMRQQAKEQLVSAAYSKAVEDHKLRVIGQPFSPTLEKVEVEHGKALAFELEVEVAPEFELPTLEGIAVNKPLMSVTDEMVAKEVEKLCIQEGRLEERQEPEAGDYLTGHAKLEGSDGKVHFESEGIVVQCPTADKNGKGMIVGLVVDDLAKQLGLPKPGEVKTVKVKGPENHENEALRGQDLKVTYKPARVDRIIPAAVEDLVQRFGMSDAQQMKDFIRDRLQQRVMIEQQSVMRQQVAKHLIEQTKMDLPERLTATQAARNLERRRLELMYRGMDPQKIEEHLADLRRGSAAQASGELKIFFVLDKAAEQMGVRVTEQEVNGRIAQMAIERNERPEKLRQDLINSNQVQTVFLQIREHKTMDAILAKAKVTEMAAEEFNKLAGAKA